MDIQSITPIDGRYKEQVKELSEYFSEYALIKYRIFIETEYFVGLCQVLPELSEFDINIMRDIHQKFDIKEAKFVKQLEKKTNHDVKAIEYYIGNKLSNLNLPLYKNFVHFGITSQDINNPANMLQLKNALTNIYFPLINNILADLSKLSTDLSTVVIISRTHGQPASPTILGKEIYVFCERLQNELQILQNVKYSTKFGGAVGNFNAHCVAAPEIDWPAFSDTFIGSLGMVRNKYTTQIDHYDNYAVIFDSLRRMNTILIDFDRDLWSYISMNYFKQKIVAGETGSSTMPHKVNPIDFENSEGNLLLANNLLNFLSNKLPVSRLQRDLTDSTTLRNMGTVFGYILIGMKSLRRGVSKLEINHDVINADLLDNWIVVAEGVQTVLRRAGYTDSYEKLKEFTRVNGKITQELMNDFINSLEIDYHLKVQLMNITPYNYYGKMI